ncbi:hypothetical protein CLAIMM_03249 [Cladophialophora immunda]|nr:hypothetical protein CLAIMM_03249 [Cladophialophora immunda]
MTGPTAASGLSEIVSTVIPDLAPYEELYKDLHRHPGLSLQESYAASIAAQHLRTHGYEVTTSIGGHGLIGALHNCRSSSCSETPASCSGKTLLIRAELDALPVLEQTGLAYASTVRQIDVRDGVEKPVMHACGHDMHIACTAIFLFQPNEEGGGGAQAMVEDGLYDPQRHGCKVPDVVLAQHVGGLPVGTIQTRRGAMASAADSIKITMYGSGGHAAMPHRTIDPVLLASHLVVRLQGIVAREVEPRTTAVVTVASIQAGQAENVIPSEATIKINVRTWDPETREKVLSAIRRIVQAECDASGCVRAPIFETISQFPPMSNDVEVTKKLEEGFAAHFGPQRYCSDGEAMNASDDFAYLATTVDKPYCYWRFGGIDPAAKPIHVNHSPFFAPILDTALKTGVEAIIVAALSILGRDGEYK